MASGRLGKGTDRDGEGWRWGRLDGDGDGWRWCKDWMEKGVGMGGDGDGWRWGWVEMGIGGDEGG